jgi:hypothetical protein
MQRAHSSALRNRQNGPRDPRKHRSSVGGVDYERFTLTLPNMGLLHGIAEEGVSPNVNLSSSANLLKA